MTTSSREPLLQDLYQTLVSHPSTRDTLRAHPPRTYWAETDWGGGAPFSLDPNVLINYPEKALLYFPPDVRQSRTVFIATGGQVLSVRADQATTLSKDWSLFCIGYSRVFGGPPTQAQYKSYFVLRDPLAWPMVEALADKNMAHEFCRHPAAPRLVENFRQKLDATPTHCADDWVKFLLKRGRPPLNKDEVTYDALCQVHLPRFGLTLPYESPIKLKNGERLVCTGSSVALAERGPEPVVWINSEPVTLHPTKTRLQLEDMTPYTVTTVCGAEPLAARLRTKRDLGGNNSFAALGRAYEIATGRVLDADLYRNLAQSVPPISNIQWVMDIATHTLVPSPQSSRGSKDLAIPLSLSPERLAALMFVEGFPNLARACQLNESVVKEPGAGTPGCEEPRTQTPQTRRDSR